MCGHESADGYRADCRDVADSEAFHSFSCRDIIERQASITRMLAKSLKLTL